MAKIDILSMDLEELSLTVTQLGEPSFRAKQIYQWLHQKNVDNFDAMTNLSKTLREKLSNQTKISAIKQIEKKQSSSDGTVKYLFALENDSMIESVFMKYSYGNAACISTQVGCRMGCSFCASTLEGVERNLSAGEMLSQIYRMQEDTGEKISSVVLMGSGEPLDNYENVLKFIHIINSKEGLNLGQRHITLSTCGLIERIYDLAERNLQITLAVSLHAPNDTIRNQIMPVSKANPINKLLAACKYYADHTKRRITFEYALISGVNDSDECAKELAMNLKHMLAHVNLIPINEVKERNYQKSSTDRIQKFAEILESRGIETTLRRRLGSDINASCGQLRRGYRNK